jgi:hypothetical protein
VSADLVIELADPCDTVHALDDFLVRHFFEDPVAANHNKIVLLCHVENSDFRSRDYHFGITAVSRVLRLYITDCSTYRQPTRLYSLRTGQCLRGLSRRRVRQVIDVLVNFSTFTLDALLFIRVFGLVIPGQPHVAFTLIDGHHCTTIAQISNVGNILHKQNDNRTTPAPLNFSIQGVKMRKLQKVCLSLSK